MFPGRNSHQLLFGLILIEVIIITLNLSATSCEFFVFFWRDELNLQQSRLCDVVVSLCWHCGPKGWEPKQLIRAGRKAWRTQETAVHGGDLQARRRGKGYGRSRAELEAIQHCWNHKPGLKQRERDRQSALYIGYWSSTQGPPLCVHNDTAGVHNEQQQ